MVGIARRATLARPAGAVSPGFAASTLPSPPSTILNPALRGASAARYHTLSRPTQSPSTDRSLTAPRSSMRSTWPFVDQTISVGCWPWNFSVVARHACRVIQGRVSATARGAAPGFSTRKSTSIANVSGWNFSVWRILRPSASPVSTRSDGRSPDTVMFSVDRFIATTFPAAPSPDEARRPAGPRSPTMTIGLLPRYFRVSSWSFPPSLLTTAR